MYSFIWLLNTGMTVFSIYFFLLANFSGLPYEPLCEKTGSSGFPTRSDTNHAVQSQMARGLKFRIYEVEGLYYLCSENKGADQLRGYHEADLHLCFRICEKPVFS